MKCVIIVNGKPQSGKTTFQEMCKDYLNINEMAYCHIHSSIDYIKNIYRQLGWNGRKTDKARKDLSLLKQMWIDNCDGPLKNLIEFIMKLDRESDHVIFVDVREESEIIKFRETLDALRHLDIRCTTLFVSRQDNDGLEHGNKSDDNVGQNMSIYEHIIHNDYLLTDLRVFADSFIRRLF